MRTVDVPGGTAKFKTREELRGRDTKLVKAAVIAAQSAIQKLGDDAERKPGETDAQAAARLSKALQEKKITFTAQEATSLLDMREAIAVAYLHSWTLELPLPTLETIGDLPDKLYEALDDAIGGELLNATTGQDFSPNPDQSSPTGPSSASNGDLRAESSQELPSTSNSMNDTEASAIEKSTPV
jgi:hypothetical protein